MIGAFMPYLIPYFAAFALNTMEFYQVTTFVLTAFLAYDYICALSAWLSKKPGYQFFTYEIIFMFGMLILNICGFTNVVALSCAIYGTCNIILLILGVRKLHSGK